MPLKLLLVSNFFPPNTVGGAEIVAFREALALRARGHEVTVFAGAYASEESPLGSLSFAEYQGLPVYRLAMRSLDASLNFYWPAAAARMRAIIASHQIEAVHFHNIMGLGANLVPAANAAGMRCIVTLHDHWGFCLRQTLLRPSDALCRNFEECHQCLGSVQPSRHVSLPTRIRRDYIAWCLGRADELVAPSQYMSSVYGEAGIGHKPVLHISNGIDLAALPEPPKEPSPQGRVRFLCSAYLGEHKGIPVLLEALKILVEDATLDGRWHLTLAGDGHLRGEIEKRLQEPGLARHVTFAGRMPRHELLARLKETDVTVLASVWPENEPVSILESTASGTAQIATRLGGSMEMVEHQESGLLVAPGDAWQLAAAMRNYILHPEMAAQHGQHNWNRRDHFDEASTIERLEQLLSGTSKHHAAVPDAKHPVIICGSVWPSSEVGAVVNRLHEHLDCEIRPRLLWHEWCDPAMWKEASLLWLWDRYPAEGLVSLALKHGVPVLAASNYWSQGLARHYGSVVQYETYLEGMAKLRVLLHVPNLREEFCAPSHTAAEAAVAFSPMSAFALRSESADRP